MTFRRHQAEHGADGPPPGDHGHRVGLRPGLFDGLQEPLNGLLAPYLKLLAVPNACRAAIASLMAAFDISRAALCRALDALYPACMEAFVALPSYAWTYESRIADSVLDIASILSTPGSSGDPAITLDALPAGYG